jgi:hypothetical protein
MLADHAAHRQAAEVRALDLQRIEQAEHVVGEHRRCRRRPARRCRPWPRVSKRSTVKCFSSAASCGCHIETSQQSECDSVSQGPLPETS